MFLLKSITANAHFESPRDNSIFVSSVAGKIILSTRVSTSIIFVIFMSIFSYSQ